MGIKNRNSICIWSPFMRCLVPARQPQDTGAPNNRMFPNTPEVSQMVFSTLQKPVWLIWSCLKNYLSCSDVLGELWSSRKSQVAFSSHPKVLATLIGPGGQKFQDIKQLCSHQKMIGDVLSLYRNFQDTFFNNNRNILVSKYE